MLAIFGGLGVFPVAAQASSASVPNWAKLDPVNHPFETEEAAAAYDAATGTVVQFGGAGPRGASNATWIWNGTTWTKQALASGFRLTMVRA